MLTVFIDTQLLLDFYRLSRGDLEELRKLARLHAHEDICILFTEFTFDEFSRNREKVIADSLKSFSLAKVELPLPNIVRAHDEAKALTEIARSFKALVDTIAADVRRAALSKSLLADDVIQTLIDTCKLLPVPEYIFDKAMRRHHLRRPPGKKDSVGDGVHWEWLLDHVETGTDLHLVSRDGDFASDLNPTELKRYLSLEWRTLKSSDCIL